MNQPRPNPVEAHGYRFDSTWEYQVYELLLNYFPKEDIRVHVDVTLYKETKEIAKLGLNIDFQIISQDLWIEAKGDVHALINDAFKVKYHVLARVYPHLFNRLIVVDNKGGKRLPARGKTTLSLPGLERLFRELNLKRIR